MLRPVVQNEHGGARLTSDAAQGRGDGQHGVAVVLGHCGRQRAQAVEHDQLRALGADRVDEPRALLGQVEPGRFVNRGLATSAARMRRSWQPLEQVTLTAPHRVCGAR